MDAQSEIKEQPRFEDDCINLVVKDQHANEVRFKVNRHKTKMEKVFNAFYHKTGRDPGSLRFLFEGTRVNPQATPEQFGMDDGDTIDAVEEQVGGTML
ncbi:hypothetical protein GPECTOR_16g532 [Gonium pectorale]|uniref:Small ubiquitin-related modifier n=1 Tax=Gonium pectorale TaxID=33097 RepID=A0A150GKI3_GONPE|nr:hypothetical protein GPECTOR_16g532 [Gonium pectorale]|eukprot:KXZ50359.1 hypothetical protein GPECTOR_16g532 [Gonium pectorale]